MQELVVARKLDRGQLVPDQDRKSRTELRHPVAANGITGDAEDRKFAHDLVSKALAKRLRLVVITRSEIEQFESGADLVRLIKEKLCQLVVSGTVWP
jgi:hypothetical protein